MRIKKVPSPWIARWGNRLDAGPYLSGAVDARMLMESPKFRSSKLSSVTSAIYHAGRESRSWVSAKEYGVPFLSSSDILRADLTNLAFISRKQVSANPGFLIRKGWTLITRSGTIGRMVYVRPDMDGMACSEHAMRVVPDERSIAPGYLYSFLRSRYGVPMVIGGTYGSIIQSIEPEHIADLPVPRLDEKTEFKTHELVEEAATQLTRYGDLLRRATRDLFDAIGIEDIESSHWHIDRSHLGWEQQGLPWGTFRALNYEPRSVATWSELSLMPHSRLGDLCDPTHFTGRTFFTRVDCEPEFGRMLVGQRQAFQFRPDGRWISKKSIEGLGLVVPKGTVLIPSHGTLGEQELYCRSVVVTDQTSEYAFSGDFFRCIPIGNQVSGFYLFAFLRSETAFRLLRSMSTGGKQQSQHLAMIRAMPIPRLPERQEAEIGNLVCEAADSFDRALKLEDDALSLVESAIREVS